ncbi:hypothetical protein [Frigoriglobus tundricola]|uniref:Uncharacterized protein n=1 Tax=Frigoriglobus tundricola TaxID=2774151 RepID=A0A6M5YYG2_9BACT|nr:hypothetical protein [Frigoriglobus tundricola]QJW99157.1 hypothetical protein FTUN_6757 [Frigoriglobus tundricola]
MNRFASYAVIVGFVALLILLCIASAQRAGDGSKNAIAPAPSEFTFVPEKPLIVAPQELFDVYKEGGSLGEVRLKGKRLRIATAGCRCRTSPVDVSEEKPQHYFALVHAVHEEALVVMFHFPGSYSPQIEDSSDYVLEGTFTSSSDTASSPVIQVIVNLVLKILTVEDRTSRPYALVRIVNLAECHIVSAARKGTRPSASLAP